MRRFFASTVRQQESGLNMLDYNPAVWLDAQDAESVVLTDGKVSQWSDKSSNLNHAIQSDAAKRPLYSNSPISNNLNAIEITDGGDVGFVSSFSVAIAEIIIVTAYKTGVETTFNTFRNLFCSSVSPGVSSINRILGDSGTANLRNDFASFTSQVYKNNSSTSSNVILPLPLSVCDFKGSQINQVWRILRYDPSNPERNFHGFTGEIVMFANQLTAADRTDIVNHLMTKWGIS